jgi:hypothetical protein
MLTGLLKPDPRRFQQLLNVMGAHIPLLYPVFPLTPNELVFEKS